MERPTGPALWMCRDHCTKARHDPFEVADRFEVQIRSALVAPPLEATIPIKEYLYVCPHSRYIMQTDRLNGMPRCIPERAIRARWNFENCSRVSCRRPIMSPSIPQILSTSDEKRYQPSIEMLMRLTLARSTFCRKYHHFVHVSYVRKHD
jgi:hypothetical protein